MGFRGKIVMQDDPAPGEAVLCITLLLIRSRASSLALSLVGLWKLRRTDAPETLEKISIHRFLGQPYEYLAKKFSRYSIDNKSVAQHRPPLPKES